MPVSKHAQKCRCHCSVLNREASTPQSHFHCSWHLWLHFATADTRWPQQRQRQDGTSMKLHGVQILLKHYCLLSSHLSRKLKWLHTSYLPGHALCSPFPCLTQIRFTSVNWFYVYIQKMIQLLFKATYSTFAKLCKTISIPLKCTRIHTLEKIAKDASRFLDLGWVFLNVFLNLRLWMFSELSEIIREVFDMHICHML